LVAAGVADEKYKFLAIGVAKPMGIFIETYGTSK
jgi:S-adenosylmethionine synthetase